MRALFLGSVFALGAAGFAQAQDWTGASKGVDEGTVYRQAGTAETPLIRVMRVSEIEAACSCDLTAEAGPTAQSQIEFGLSTMWIDVYDLATTKHNSSPHMMGDAETEDGSRNILAGFYDGGAEPELRVYLNAIDDFNLDDAKAGLNALGSQPSTTMAAASPPPRTSSRTSGADLLAGVRRDLAKPQTNPTPKSKPARGRTSGADLLAGIRRDVYAPSIAREKERVIALKAAQDAAIKGAIVSGDYREPIIFDAEGLGNFIANWIDIGNGVMTAKANDRRAPRMTTYSFTETNLRWNNRAVYERELKKAGLSSVRFDGPEALEVSQKITGQFSSIISGKAKRAGKPVRVFANIGHDPKTGGTAVFIYDAPQQQWDDWGGIAPVMVKMSVHNQGDFSAAARAELRAMTPLEEIAIFEEHYTGRMISLFQGIAMTQAATLNSMRSFNMSSATCAGMENCTVTPDGTGGYDAVID